MNKQIFKSRNEGISYISPSVAVLEMSVEGVLCSSTTEDNDIIDGEW